VSAINALAALKARGTIDAQTFCFRQIGRVGLSGFDMVAERNRLGLDGMVELGPSLPRREILAEMMGASCLLLLQPGTTVSIPGKLFEYFAAGRPILAIAEQGETADLVRASGCGIAVLPDDQAGIERALEQLLSNRQMSAAPPLELYDGDVRTRELVGILEAAAQRQPGGVAVHRTGRESLDGRASV
jgi:glycosyltransferase involved in cell wall biosynthesis